MQRHYDNIINNPDSTSEQINEIENQLKQFEIKQWEKAQVKTHNTLKLEGEKPSKIFLAIEKQQVSNNQMRFFLNKEGKFVDKPVQMVDCVNKFYRDLYCSENINNVQMETIVASVKTKTFKTDDVIYLERDIHEIELRQALFQMSKDKSPGIDGLTVEFYRAFWYTLKDDLVDVIKECKHDNFLPNTMHTAVIRLIYKNAGCREDLKNWRPISLLTVDYKLISKVLTNRLKKLCLTQLARSRHAVFMEGIFITT